MYKPQFIIKDENIERVIENKNNILCFKPFDVENKRALYAVLKENDNLYYKTQITESQPKIAFPYNPIYFLGEYTDFDFNDYVNINNHATFNSNYLEGFKYKFAINDKNCFLYATFNTGVATYIQREKINGFLKHNGIEPYIELLEKYKEFNPKHDFYKILEYYDKGNGYFDVGEEFINERKLSLRLKNII